jgi:hypothetical protein
MGDFLGLRENAQIWVKLAQAVPLNSTVMMFMVERSIVIEILAVIKLVEWRHNNDARLD